MTSEVTRALVPSSCTWQGFLGPLRMFEGGGKIPKRRQSLGNVFSVVIFCFNNALGHLGLWDLAKASLLLCLEMGLGFVQHSFSAVGGVNHKSLLT